MSRRYQSDIGIDFTGKAKSAFGKGPQDQKPLFHAAAYGQMNPRIKDYPTPKIANKKSEKSELEKKTPPDISEKTMHKLKDEYGHDRAGKEKAYATAWSIENKMKKDDSIGGPEPMAMGEKCEKCGMEKSLCKCMGKTEDVSVPSQKANPGSGGETKEVGLRKDTMDPHGVGGKQPVGQDGGGANKVAPGLSGTHQPSPPHKVLNSMSPKHVDAAAKIAQIRGGSKWLSATHSKAARVSPKVAAPASQRFHGALPLQRNEIK